MNKSLYQQVTAHLMIGSLSILTGLLAFEGILAIALLSQKISSTEPTQVVEQPPQESHQVVEEPEAPGQEMVKQRSLCSSNFYAVIEIESSAVCVQNPTLQMAHWGPPSSSWFYSADGEFHSSKSDSTSSDYCACLTGQEGYQPISGLQGRNPVDHILFEDVQVPISKWVCGDPCVMTIKGEKHES